MRFMLRRTSYEENSPKTFPERVSSTMGAKGIPLSLISVISNLFSFVIKEKPETANKIMRL